jgi:sulfide:quinone oxidoreductase
MKSLVILGAGTGGTILANRLRHRIPLNWQLTVVDPNGTHVYQPGLLYVPFGGDDRTNLVRVRHRTLRSGVHWIRKSVERIDPLKRRVNLIGGGRLDYDLLVIATGSTIHPELLPGLTGKGWRDSAHDFYTRTGAMAPRLLASL